MLATCSTILQLWNNDNYTLINEFGHDHVPSTDYIKCIDWKKDNSNYLVFTYKQTGRVQLYDIQKNKSVELSTVKAQWCSFSQSGKYLSVTNEDSQAQIWDVNSGRISQTFSSIDQSPMECLCWGNGDSYIAAGTRKGNVFLYNQLTKQTFSSFTMKHSNKLSTITSIKWSPHKDLLATTSTDGLLSLWNSRLKELIISIHSHKAPSTDLCFSPHHDAFLVSSGMDGSLCCFDVTQQKILSTISVYSPLTSVDFHPNGSLVAVGTMGQNASIYDLRDPKQKLAHLINEDHGNVYSVRFDNGLNQSIQKIQSTNNQINENNQISNKSLSTFAQQTNRSRHSSSSSTTTTNLSGTSNENDLSNRISSTNISRSNQSRERSFSNQNNSSTLNQFQSNSSSISTNRTKKPIGNEQEQKRNQNQFHSQDCMTFDEFTRLCGISSTSNSNSNRSSHSSNENENENENEKLIYQRIEYLLDQRLNFLREDLKEDFHKTKLSIQMNFLVELNKLRDELINQIQSNSLNSQLIDEIQHLRDENKLLRQLQPKL